MRTRSRPLATEEDMLSGQEWRTWQSRFENPCMDNKCGKAPTQLGAFLEQKSHSDFFEAFLHPIVNDDILSTADVPFVRLFWSQNSPRTSSVSPPGGRPSIISPQPCPPVPIGEFEIRKEPPTARLDTQIGLPRVATDAYSVYSIA